MDEQREMVTKMSTETPQTISSATTGAADSTMTTVKKITVPRAPKLPTPAGPGAPMDLQGNLETFKLPDILQLLSQSRKNGTLGIQRDSDIVMVYFSEGQIIYAYGPRQTYHLGQMLKSRDKITPVQLADAVKMQTEGGKNSKRLGQILMEMSAVDRADIIEVVTEQVEELLFSMLSWETGSFKFYENQYPTDEEVTVKLSTENIILEGLRRLDEMNHLRDSLPAMDTTLSIAQTFEGHRIDVALSHEEWNLLALVDGHRTIRDVVEVSNLSEVESLKRLAALKMAGLVTEVTKAESEKLAETQSGGINRLEGMMTRLAGMLEEYLQGSAPPATTAVESAMESSTESYGEPDKQTLTTGAGTTGPARMIGDRRLTEILSETTPKATPNSKSENSGDKPEEKMWNEFTN